MTEHLRRFGLWLLCTVAIAACGPSAEEVRMHTLSNELHAEVQEQRQYNADLKLRLQLAAARNRVLVDLVQGLTSDTARARGQTGAATGLESADTSLHALNSDLSALVASVHHSEQDIAAMQAQQDALQTELSRAKAAVEVVRTQQEKEKAQSDASTAALARFAHLITERMVEVHVLEDRILVELGADLLFASSDARVLPSGKLLLDGVAEALAQVEGQRIEIAAHTDSRLPRGQRYPDNWRLSSDRSLNVLLYLIEHGVPKERLSATAYADTRPIGDPTTDAGQRQNRRIEIVLWPAPAQPPAPAEPQPQPDRLVPEPVTP